MFGVIINLFQVYDDPLQMLNENIICFWQDYNLKKNNLIFLIKMDL